VLPPHTLELSCDKIGSPWEKPHAHRRQWRVHNPTLTLYNSQRSLGRWGTDINMFARFLTVLAIALLIEQSANAAEKGWMLRQSTIGTGDTEAYLTPTCFKMIYLVSGLTIVATAPRWKAQIFNPRKQARFTETLPDLGREIRSIVAFTNQDISPTSFQKDKTAVVLGHKALRYKFEVNVGTTGLHKGETWFATDMPIFKDLAEYGATVCMQPAMRSIRFWPLESKVYLEHRSIDFISTKEIKPFTAPPHFWDVPSNYKIGKSAFGIEGSNLESILKEEFYGPGAGHDNLPLGH